MAGHWKALRLAQQSQTKARTLKVGTGFRVGGERRRFGADGIWEGLGF